MKLNTDQKVALHIKQFMKEDEEHNRANKQQVGATILHKGSSGTITGFINGEQFLLIDTSKPNPSYRFSLINAQAVKRIKGLIEIMNWNVALHWYKGLPQTYNRMGYSVHLEKDKHYSLEDLVQMNE